MSATDALRPKVIFGGLDLGRYPYGFLMREGSDGVAANAYSDLDADLRDGTIVTRTRTENREVSRVVVVEGPNLRAVADATTALARECEKPRNTLVLDPGDGYAPPKVYDTFTAQIVEVFKPAAEAANLRLFEITWPALPFARSVDPFTVTGVTSTGTTTTTVNDASSTTGWSALESALGAWSGEVWVDVDSLNQSLDAQPSLVLTPAAPIDMAGFPFLLVSWRVPPPLAGGYDAAPTVYADGSVLARLSDRYDAGTGRMVSTFACPDASVISLRIRSPRVSSYVGGVTTGEFRVDKVEKSDVAPAVSPFQKVTRAEVPGSARTPASLSVSGDDGLGDVLVYTCPELAAGYIPALSTWATVAGTADASSVSGWRFSTSSSHRFAVPASTLPPGEYELVAHVRRLAASADPVTFTAECQTSVGGVEVGAPQIRTTVHTVSYTPTYDYVTLGFFSLPPADLPRGSAGSVLVAIDSTSIVEYGEAWLLYTPDDGSTAVSRVQCGDATRLWLDAATVDHPEPRVLVGDEPDRSDAYAPSGAVTNWSEHQVVAGDNFALVVTPGAQDTVTTWLGYARWHTHPAS